MVSVREYSRLMPLPIFLIAAAIGKVAGAVYTLSGATSTQTDAVSPYNSRSGFRINSDGTIDTAKSKDGAAITYAQISADTDWVIPNNMANADHDVRVTNVVHNGHAGWNSQAAADDTWIDLGTNRLWDIQSSSAEDINTTFDIEIRDGTGTTVATGSYTARILNTV
jgi:hypothetical protein